MVQPTQLFFVFHGRFFAKLSPSPPFPVVFFEALAEKISQTTGHLGEAKAFCAKVRRGWKWREDAKVGVGYPPWNEQST